MTFAIFGSPTTAPFYPQDIPLHSQLIYLNICFEIIKSAGLMGRALTFVLRSIVADGPMARGPFSAY